MPALILDSTVWLAAHDPRDAMHVASRDLVLDEHAELAALDLTLYEVANVATKKWHDPDAAERLTRLVVLAADARLVRADVELLRLATGLAAEHGLSVYDAAYAAARERTGWQLVSADADLTEPGFAVKPTDVQRPTD